jgi:hypothetical protein
MGPGAEAGGAAGHGVDTATKGAFGFLVFMMVLNILNILDRQLLPTFGPEIKADLGLSNGQFGLLTGIMFTLLRHPQPLHGPGGRRRAQAALRRLWRGAVEPAHRRLGAS